MWMAAMAEVMATTEATTVTTGQAPIFFSSAMGMTGGATSNIIAIEELRVAGTDTPQVAVTADTPALEAMAEAEDDIEPNNPQGAHADLITL